MGRSPGCCRVKVRPNLPRVASIFTAWPELGATASGSVRTVKSTGLLTLSPAHAPPAAALISAAAPITTLKRRRFISACSVPTVDHRDRFYMVTIAGRLKSPIRPGQPDSRDTEGPSDEMRG